MDKHTRILDEIKTTDPSTVLEVQLYYNIGGMNYFTGETMQRGLYVSVTPVQYSSDRKVRSYSAFSGTCMAVKPMERFNAKKLAEFKVSDSLITQLVRHVLSKNKNIQPL